MIKTAEEILRECYKKDMHHSDPLGFQPYVYKAMEEYANQTYAFQTNMYNEGIADAFEAGWISARQKGSYKCNGTYAEDYMIFLEQLYLNNFKKQLNMTKIVEDPKHEDSYWRFIKAVKKMVDAELEQIEPKEVKKEMTNEERLLALKRALIIELQNDDFKIESGKIKMDDPEYSKMTGKPLYQRGYIEIMFIKPM